MKAVRMFLVVTMTALLAVVTGALSMGSATAAAPVAPSMSPYPMPCGVTLSVSTTNPFPGQTITIAGANLAKNDDIALVLDNGVVLKQLVTSPTGTFSTPVTLPAQLRGTHLIAITGSSVTGKDYKICPISPVQITVQTHSTDNGGLASTGTNVLIGIVIALALLGAGVLLLRGGRRRTSHHAGR